MGCCGSRRVMSTRDDPIILGEPNGEPAVRARVTIGIGGLTAGDVGYFSGSHTAVLIAQGVIIPQ